jgi:hypothetical protein
VKKQQGSGEKEGAPLPGNPPRDRLGKTGFSRIAQGEFATILPRRLDPCSNGNQTERSVCVFQGMAESIWSDGVESQNQNQQPNPTTKPWVPDRAPSRWSVRDPGKRTRREDHAPSHSPQMSSDRAIPRSGCSPALPVSASPGTCEHKSLDGQRETDYHRTVGVSFPSCLTRGVHPTYQRSSAFICGQ